MVNSAERVFERKSSSRSRDNEPDEVAILNEHRRNALEQIDNARFSYDDSLYLLSSSSLTSPAVGPMRRYASLQASVSLPMRKSIHLFS